MFMPKLCSSTSDCRWYDHESWAIVDQERVLHWVVFILGLPTHLAESLPAAVQSEGLPIQSSSPLSFHSLRPASPSEALPVDSASLPFILHKCSPSTSLAHLVLS